MSLNLIKLWNQCLFSLTCVLAVASLAYSQNNTILDCDPMPTDTYGNIVMVNGDTNGDNVIDHSDILNVFDDIENNESPRALSDLNGDGVIDDQDLAIVVHNSDNFHSSTPSTYSGYYAKPCLSLSLPILLGDYLGDPSDFSVIVHAIGCEKQNIWGIQQYPEYSGSFILSRFFPVQLYVKYPGNYCVDITVVQKNAVTVNAGTPLTNPVGNRATWLTAYGRVRASAPKQTLNTLKLGDGRLVLGKIPLCSSDVTPVNFPNLGSAPYSTVADASWHYQTGVDDGVLVWVNHDSEWSPAISRDTPSSSNHRWQQIASNITIPDDEFANNHHSESYDLYYYSTWNASSLENDLGTPDNLKVILNAGSDWQSSSTKSKKLKLYIDCMNSYWSINLTNNGTFSGTVFIDSGFSNAHLPLHSAYHFISGVVRIPVSAVGGADAAVDVRPICASLPNDDGYDPNQGTVNYKFGNYSHNGGLFAGSVLNPYHGGADLSGVGRTLIKFKIPESVSNSWFNFISSNSYASVALSYTYSPSGVFKANPDGVSNFALYNYPALWPKSESDTTWGSFTTDITWPYSNIGVPFPYTNLISTTKQEPGNYNNTSSNSSPTFIPLGTDPELLTSKDNFTVPPYNALKMRDEFSSKKPDVVVVLPATGGFYNYSSDIGEISCVLSLDPESWSSAASALWYYFKSKENDPIHAPRLWYLNDYSGNL